MSLAYLCCWVRDKMATHLWFSVRIESGETGGTVRAVGMFPEPVIVGLLESACPSIQYRVRWEILAEPPGSETMEALHEQILQDQAVQELMRSQQADGWLGERFHGYDSLEAGIRLLCEKGVCAEQPVLARALGALESNSERIQRELGTVGVVLDAGGFGGTSMMRAAIFAYAGQEQQPLVQEQIQVALEGFQAVMAVESLRRCRWCTCGTNPNSLPQPRLACTISIPTWMRWGPHNGSGC
ncbi:MAG: hypothetical protein P8074_25485 [Anaerolineales bacterium]